MSAEFTEVSPPGSGTLAREALRNAIEGTGLEATFTNDPTGFAMYASWLTPEGSDGKTGYLVRCKFSTVALQGLPDGPLSAHLRVDHSSPSAGPAGRRDGLSDLTEVLDLTIAGPQAGDARIIAAAAVTAVHGHQDLTGKEPDGGARGELHE
jgi:hypothetical protein